MSPDQAETMRRENRFYGRWCKLFKYHRERLKMTASEFARRAHRSQQAIQGYESGRARPPLNQIQIYAAILGLTGADKADFILAGQEAHVPEIIWRRMRELEAAARKVGPAPSKDKAADEKEEREALVAQLVGVLADVERLFYDRTGLPTADIPALRARTGVAIRRLIVAHAKPPAALTAQGDESTNQAMKG